MPLNQNGRPDLPSRLPESPKSRWKLVYIIAIHIIAIAGVIIVISLALNGAFSKDKDTNSKKKQTKKTTVAEMSSEEPVSDPSDDLFITPDPSSRHLHVTSLSQVTDKQMTLMQQKSRERFDEGDYECGKLPSKVTLDAFNYVGCVLADWSSTPTEELSFVYLTYQVLVTDATGDVPVKRQFFWTIGYSEVYQDGTVDTSVTNQIGLVIYYENWTTPGTENLDSVVEQINYDIEVLEDQLDRSLLLPFDSSDQKDYGEKSRVTRLNQINPGQMKKLRNEGEDYYKDFYGYLPSGVHRESIEYKGSAIVASYSEDKSIVYMVYEIKLNDNTGNQTEKKTIYWYIGYFDVYKNGEMYVCYIEPLDELISFDKWSTSGLSSIADVRRSISGRYNDYYYEDNLDGTIYRVGKAPEDEGYIFPDSNIAVVSDDEIAKLTDEELRMAINELLARYGYIFRNQEMLEYYRQFGWYEERIPADEWDSHGEDYYFNDIEQKNFETFIAERNSRSEV
ncbi:MAG: YARHG domain-containing protein [Clostridiales bacterium]|nr:YARHG domain-containing protein [Clostridiales bacterium]